MTVYESDLPGVGKKHEVELDDGQRLVVVTHNTGKREVYLRPDPDADSEKLFELPDELARRVGTILEGAYFQPIQTEEIETVLGDDTLLEWVEVEADAPVAGGSLRESDLRGRFGVSVIAVERGGEVVANPGPGTELAAGDTLVVLGPKEGCQEFRSFATGK